MLPELGAKPAEVRIMKHQPNDFYCTDLEIWFKRGGICTTLLDGISTEAGVEATARAGRERGYEQLLVEDALAARHTERH